MTNATLTLRGAALAATLLWSSTADDGEPLDRCYCAGDIAADDLERLTAEFDAFTDAADAALDAAMAAGELPPWFDPSEHSLHDLGPNNEGQLEHDYVLTRNHHGAGFWDGDWCAMGETLTALAGTLPELEPLVGDDGQIYLY
jgi:hypothetical protein